MLATDAAERKAIPITTGFIDYFPDAMVEVAILSRIGNEQHNPGQPLHWAKEKSTDHANCIVRHLLERGTIDTDGVRHSAKVAWRAMALLQIEIEKAREKQAPYVQAPVPESKFGFTVGETVNLKNHRPGHLPGTVVGFNGGISILWECNTGPAHGYKSYDLRHGE